MIIKPKKTKSHNILIGPHCLLPIDHPVGQRLDAAGMGRDLRLEELEEGPQTYVCPVCLKKECNVMHNFLKGETPWNLS